MKYFAYSFVGLLATALLYFFVNTFFSAPALPQRIVEDSVPHAEVVPPPLPVVPSFRDSYKVAHPELTDAQIDAHIAAVQELNNRINKRREELLNAMTTQKPENVFLIETQLKSEFEAEVLQLQKDDLPKKNTGPLLGAPVK